MYTVNITNDGEYGFKVDSDEYEFTINTKAKKGISPPSAFLASLGSCIGVYIRKYADGAKIELKEFNVNVEAELKKEPRYHFQNINVTIERKQALSSFIKNCPVHNTLESSPQTNIRIV